VERRHPTNNKASNNEGGKDEMTKASTNLQELRRKIYIKAKTEKAWRVNQFLCVNRIFNFAINHI
jgi:hypothetical protein